MPGEDPPPRVLLLRAVRIPLECILVSYVLSIGIIKVQIRFLNVKFVSLGVNRPCVIHTLVINTRDVLNVSMGKTVDTDEKAALFKVKIPLRIVCVAECQHLSKCKISNFIHLPKLFVSLLIYLL